jgi:hypothetical protein
MTVAVFECLVCRPPEFAGAFGFDEAGKSEFQAGMIVIGSIHCRGETPAVAKAEWFRRADRIFCKWELRTSWKAASALDSAWETKIRGS